MTNRERYQKTYAKLRVSQDFCVEPERRTRRRRALRPAAAAVLAAVMLCGVSVGAFAGDISDGCRRLGVMLGLVSHEEGDLRVVLGGEKVSASEKDVYALDFSGVTEYETIYRLSDTETATVLPIRPREATADDLKLFRLRPCEEIRYQAIVTERGENTVGLNLARITEDGTEYLGYAVWPEDIRTDGDGRVIFCAGRHGAALPEEMDITDCFDAKGRAVYTFEYPLSVFEAEDGTVEVRQSETRTLCVRRDGGTLRALLLRGDVSPEFDF